LRDANDPLPGKSIPEKKGGLATNAPASVSGEDEELGDVEVLGCVAGG
jgi:hypothetical protein